MFRVAGIYAFGAVGQLDLRTGRQAGTGSKGGATDLFGHAGVDGGFHRNGGGHGDDKGGAARQIPRIMGKPRSAGGNRAIRHLAIGITPALQGGDRGRMGVQPHHVKSRARQRQCQGQPHIPQPQNGQLFRSVWRGHGVFLWWCRICAVTQLSSYRID